MKNLRDLSFVIRIRVEPRESGDDTPIWRGVVIEVTSGEQSYFDRLDRLVEILREQLGKMGLVDGGQK